MRPVPMCPVRTSVSLTCPRPPSPVDSLTVAQAAVIVMIVFVGLIALGAFTLVALLVVRTGGARFEPVPPRDPDPTDDKD